MATHARPGASKCQLISQNEGGSALTPGKKRRLVIGILLVEFIAALFLMITSGLLIPTEPAARSYPVRGVDVSHHQGEINWKKLAGQGIDFAFIKATEGKSFKDPRFDQNFSQARKHVMAGAYHFLSFDVSGEAQARNFIESVPVVSGMLPPVVDVELYGDYRLNPPSRKQVVQILAPMLKALEEHYGVQPILYTTSSGYRRYIARKFEQYPLWIRGVYLKPQQDFEFWQYSDRGRLKGFSDQERFIDLNVFNGSLLDLKKMLITLP